MNAFDGMQSKVEFIQKLPQGNTNHEAWRDARRNQTKQFLVMLDELPESEVLEEHPEGIPLCFRKDQLPKVSRNQVVFCASSTYIRREVPRSTPATRYAFPATPAASTRPSPSLT